MPLTKLSLGGNNDVIYKLIPPRESLVSAIRAGDGNIEKLFLRCMIIFQKVTSTEICTNIPYCLRKNPGQREIKLSGE
jgi:hypothetical protein